MLVHSVEKDGVARVRVSESLKVCFSECSALRVWTVDREAVTQWPAFFELFAIFDEIYLIIQLVHGINWFSNPKMNHPPVSAT